MWGNDDGFQRGGDGGFENTTSMFTSPAPAGAKTGKPRCIAPATIRQVLECPEEGLKVKDIDIQIVQLVGIVKSVEVSTIKVTYIIEDCTGKIMAASYLEGDTDSNVPVVENTYCTVVGSIRSQGGEKHIMVFTIYPITDLNAITEHRLAVIHMGLKAEQVDTMESKPMKQEMLSSYGSGSNQFSSINSFDMDPKYRRVYETISLSSNESGMNIQEIHSSMPVKLPMDQIRAALEHLVNEGHIFTTIDDNHFKSTESTF